MTLLWIWILAAPGAVLLADCPDARLYLLALTRGRTSEIGGRATRLTASVAHPRMVGPTASAEPSSFLQPVDRGGQSDADTIAERVEQRTEREAPSPSLPQAETAERDVEAENPLTARRNARGPK